MKPLTRLIGVIVCGLFVRQLLADNPYIFSYFTKNGEDGLHLAWSADGYKWENLNDGKSYLTPVVGESKLMRDPCVLRGPDGLFRMVWTSSWEGKTIGYASSPDLIHWSEQKAIPVMEGETGVRNCWAPEVAYDEKRGEYVIFWATTLTGKFSETASTADKGYNHRIYSTTTKDFVTFSPAKLFFEPGFNVIDATTLRADGKVYLIFKDETATPPKKHLMYATSTDIQGPYAHISAPFTRDWVEGPTAFKVSGGYLVYYDVYREHHYGAMFTKDMETWEDVTAKISVPPGVRHGTIFAVPQEIIDRLKAPR